MIIACTNCATKFRVADEKIKPGGVKVRCSKCKTVFQTPSPSQKEASPEDDLIIGGQIDSKDSPSISKNATALESEDVHLNFSLDTHAGIANPSPTPPPIAKPEPPPKKSHEKSPGKSNEVDVNISNLSAEDLGLDFTPAKPPKVAPPPPSIPHPPPEPEPQNAPLSANLSMENPQTEGPLDAASAEATGTSGDQIFDFSNDQPLEELLPDSDAGSLGHQPLEAAHASKIAPPSEETQDSIDQGLEDLLADPEQAQESLDNKFEMNSSEIPLTMPGDINLSEIAGENRVELQSPLLEAVQPSSSSPRSVNDDGIELVHSPDEPLNLDIGGTSNSDALATPSFDLGSDPSSSRHPKNASPSLMTAPNLQKKTASVIPDSLANDPLGGNSRSMNIDPMGFDFHEEGGGKLKWIFIGLVFIFLIVGFLGFMVYKVHGSFNLAKFNGATLSAFFQGSSLSSISNAPSKFSQTRLHKPKKTVINHKIEIEKSATNVIRNINNEPILIISGEALNQFPTPRRFIQIKVSIFSSSKASKNDLVAEKEVWAGTQFSRKEIANFIDQENIDRAFQYSGKNANNMNIPPGKSIPFQILILNPAKNWREFTTSAKSQSLSENF